MIVKVLYNAHRTGAFATQVITHRRCLTIFPHRPRMLSLSASVNTSWTPVPVFAEHSIYFAPISRATAAPCSGVIGVWPCALSIRFVCSSRRRSVLVPTRINGVPSQKCATSGYHWSVKTREEVRHAMSGRVGGSPYPEHWQG